MRNWRPIVKMPGTSLSASKRVVGPRQAGLLAPDHCRWAPSQGLGLGGSRPWLLGYSDGFAPDSHRLPFFSSLSLHLFTLGWSLYLSIFSRWDGASLSHLSVVLNLWTAWPASPPPKGDRIIRGPAPAWESGEKDRSSLSGGGVQERVVRWLRRPAIGRSTLPAPQWSGRG